MTTQNSNQWTAAGEAKKERRAWLQLWLACVIFVCLGLAAIIMLDNRKDGIRQAKQHQREQSATIVNSTKTRYTFMGYACTNDCSGHIAGYQWAERNGIEDEDGCTGRSNSFIEGCLAYVEENQ